VTISSHRETRP